MADDEPIIAKHEGTPPKDTKANIKNKNVENDKKVLPKSYTSTNLFIFLCMIGVTLGILLEIFIDLSRNSTQNSMINPMQSRYWILVEPNHTDSILKHVKLVLGRLGYERATNETDWDLLWSHPYPFTLIKPQLLSLKPHQRVNHLPGIGFITNKVDFATSRSKYIPKAFRLPKDKDSFLKYASENRNAVFVEKNNKHRGVILKNVTDVNTEGSKFVQEYIQKPFLVDGYKFDMGVYVVVTSVDPLRVYYYSGDVLFRYCPEKYYPLDPTNLNKYVIADDYLPSWKVPALAQAHNEFGFGMKDAFDIYLRSKGKNPAKMWEEVNKAIMEVFINKQKHLIDAIQTYPFKNNFFELLRVDLMVDEDLNVYLLEVNLSPNLIANTKPPNQLLYEQVLYNTFSLVGLTSPLHKYRSTTSQMDCESTTSSENYAECLENKAAAAMLSAVKNIAVWGNECNTSCKDVCGGICALCYPCLTPSNRDTLLQAYREHLHRGDFRRIFPPPLIQNSPTDDLKDMNPKNQLLNLWYQGKCNLDVAWCT